ncbi:MAG: PilN domain-containing protein [Filifactoraceae bacterium]
MKDFNFFSPYKGEGKEKTDKGKLLITTTSILVVGFMVISGAFQFLEYRNLTKMKSEMNSTMEDPLYKERIKIAQEKSDILEQMKIEQIFFVSLQENISKIHSVNEYIVNFIKKEMVKDMFLVSLTIYDKELSIEGRALNKSVIAQFENDLRKSNLFSKILVYEIKKSDKDKKYYDFSIRLLIKEDTDEAK